MKSFLQGLSNYELMFLLANIKEIDGSSTGDHIKREGYIELKLRMRLDGESIPARSFAHVDTTHI